jgi:two-component system, cell cycle sensor histidine kinase and response regulator CckA
MSQRPSSGHDHPEAGGGLPPPATRTIRILFVSDSEDDVAVVLHELRRGGFTPDHWVVRDADGLRAALAESAWDLVISGREPSGLSVLEALEVLHASGLDPPFIVVAGHVGEEAVVACMKAGASDFLARDDLVRLVPAVERDLREAAQRRCCREAAEALRTSEERYRLLVENSADMITLQDDAGRITFVSPSVTRLLGYPPAELIGRRLRELAQPGDVPVIAAAMEEALARGATPLLTGLHLRHREGGWRVIEGSAARLVRPDGGVGVVAVGRDVTERVELEEQLHQAQKMEAVGRLAGGVAHDFNNLLTVILGYGDLLLEQLADDRVLYQEVDEIRRAADRAATLTQQLLTFSRRQVLSLRPVDLDAVLGGMAGMLRRLIGEDIELTLRLGGERAFTRVDPVQVEQIVMNLAVNARDAMPRGGRLVIETASVELGHIAAPRRAVEPGAYVMLSVADTGHGMDAATQEHLFEPFFTTKAPGLGTGLGLSTVYGIVRQSGGTVQVTSEPGSGSTFRIYLPRVAGGPDAEVASPRIERRGGSESVVLVEDEPLVRNLVSGVLRQNGYRVVEFANGREVLARGARGLDDIQLLVTDVVMPGLNGVALAGELARGRPGLRVLFLSGYAQDLVEPAATSGPGRAFLAKPFTPDTLLRQVRELLDGPLAEAAAPPGTAGPGT